ncbi:hypothetical protein [Paludibaculum fermentans]|uniref:hypothetical protein n=1 Tax=Paludibaculum fermentans TaxID=1473598 RepID=UPI003EBC1D68
MIRPILRTLALAVLSLAASAQTPNQACVAILPAASQAADDAAVEPLRQMLQAELAARGISAVLAPGIPEAREMGCSVALAMTLKRKDRPGLGSILRSAVPGMATDQGSATYSGNPPGRSGTDQSRRPAQCKAKEEIQLDVCATPLVLGESIARRTFKARPSQAGEDLLRSLVVQAAAVDW